MNEVKWSNDLSVDAGLIDEQHKMLIQRINDLAKALESQLGAGKVASTLGFLIEYTHYHFSTEEKNMTTHNYPGLELHKKKHEEFTTTLSNLEEDFREDGATHTLANAIDTLLGNWLIEHIRGVDVGFGKFLKDNGITIAEEA